MHELQPGAQNHNARGPRSKRLASKVPPPTSGRVCVAGAVALSAAVVLVAAVEAGPGSAGLGVAGAVAGEVVRPGAEAVSAPQAANPNNPTAARGHMRRISVRVPTVGLRRLTEP